jgi:hypothetical protein
LGRFDVRAQTLFRTRQSKDEEAIDQMLDFRRAKTKPEYSKERVGFFAVSERNGSLIAAQINYKFSL